MLELAHRSSRRRRARRIVFLILLALTCGSAIALAEEEGRETGRLGRGGEFENRESMQERQYFDQWTNGLVDSKRYREMLRAAQSVPPEGTHSTQSVNTWQLIGPLYSLNPGGGYMTGRVRDIDAHNRRVLAASGGLWRFNFGAIAMSDSVPATWFGSFVSNPSDPNTILLGTGEYKIGPSGTGMYKTTNGGATWVHKTTNPEPSSFTRVRYSPDGAVLHAASDIGYYRSADGGETWSRRITGAITDLCTVNDDPNLAYLMNRDLGLYRTVDGGQTWSAITTGGIPSGQGVGDGAVTALRPIPGGPVFIYVAYDNSLWRSIDSGATWTNVTPSYNYGVSGYGPAISVCPTDPYTVLMGNVGFHRTIDGGETWTPIAVADLHADYHVFAWDDNGIGVWAGNDGGWSHSTDRGLHWDSSANVMPVSQFYTIDTERTSVGYMIGGTQDNSILFTPNQALFWTDPSISSSEGDGAGVCIDQYNPSHLWAVSGVSSGAFSFPRSRSMNGGTSWTTVVTGLDPGTGAGAIRTDNAFPVELFTSLDKSVYESSDGGDHWVKSNVTPFPAQVRNLTASTRVAGGAVLYANLQGSTQGQRLFVRDGGTWSERSAGLPDGSVVKVVPHPWAAFADEAWAILSYANYYQIFHTANRGVTWTNVTGDFPAAIPISDLVVYPWDTDQLFVGTYMGCYATHNGGANWERWTNGMPPTAKVSEMTYIDLTSSTGEFFVVASTHGRSVWKRNIAGDDPVPTVSIGPGSRAEGNSGTTSILFPVTLSYAYPMSVRVDYATSDGTATAGSDYVAATGTVVIPAGETQAWIPVTVNGDASIEPDETVTVTLSNPIRATIFYSTGTGTILDDEMNRVVQKGGYQTDGTVYAVARSDNTLYIGGDFSRVGISAGNAVAFDGTNAKPLGFPRVVGTVYAVTPDGAGGWYLGGTFSYVGGAARSNLAHVLADMSVAAWDPKPDDIVNSIAVAGNTVYVGGGFTRLGNIVRNHVAALNATTGLPTTWDPGTDGAVLGLALSGNVLYLGGLFTTVAGQPRAHVAAVGAIFNDLLPWDPSANDAVNALRVSGGTVYAAGYFTTIGGMPRRYIAALNTTNGAASSWNPDPDQYVFTIEPSGSTIYAAGSFTSIGGQPRGHIAALDAASGLATSWAPDANEMVFALAVSGSTVYAGGYFTSIGGQPQSVAAALDAGTGAAKSWNPDIDGIVYAMAASGQTVFTAGTIQMLHPQTRNSLAALDASTGALLPWNPGAHGTVFALAVGGDVVYAGGTFDSAGAQPRNRIAAIDTAASALATAWDPNAGGTVRALALTSTNVYAGGSFTTMSGTTRNRLAAISRSTGALTTWNPNANNTVYALAAQGTGLFVGGAFSSIGGQARASLAAVSGSGTGTVTTWNPGTNGAVFSILLDRSFIYVGGLFTTVAGVSRGCGALLSTTAIGNWNPATNGAIHALALNGSNEIYIGGDFEQVGGQPRKNLALLRISDSSVGTSWAPNPDNTVYALASSGSILHAGGAFQRVAGLPQEHIATLGLPSLLDAPSPQRGNAPSLAISPNPTRGGVRLDYTLAQAGHVRAGVFDVQGRRVVPIIDEVQVAGPHRLDWNGKDARGLIAPGLYFVRMEAGEERVTTRFVIVR